MVRITTTLLQIRQDQCHHCWSGYAQMTNLLRQLHQNLLKMSFHLHRVINQKSAAGDELLEKMRVSTAECFRECEGDIAVSILI